MAKVEDWNCETIFTDIIGHVQSMWRIWPAKQSNSVKNAKYGLFRRSRSFKVTEVSTNRKPVCDLLLAINSNLQARTVVELSQRIVQILVALRFWATLWGSGTTYDVHLGLIGKRVIDFLLVIIELFSLAMFRLRRYTGENRWKSAILLQRG